MKQELNIQMILVFLAILMAPTLKTSAQDSAKTEVFEFVEIRPQFPGGDQALMKFLQQHLQYPSSAMDDGIQGRVIVQFVVDTGGEISQVEIQKGVRDDLNREAVRVIKLMPKWTPGSQGNKKVKVRFRLPISFVLDDDPPAKKKSRRNKDD